MDVPSLTQPFKQPNLVHSVADLLYCLKTKSRALSAVWNSVSFGEMKTKGGGTEIDGEKRAVEKLSLACAELAECGDLKRSWESLTLAKLAEQLETSDGVRRKEVSIEGLCEELQSVLDGLSSRNVEGLTDDFGGLRMGEEVTNLSEVDLPPVPEERWKELRVGFTKLNVPAIEFVMSRDLSPRVEALKLLRVIMMVDFPSMDVWYSSQLAADQGSSRMNMVIQMVGQVFKSAIKARPYVQGEGASWWRALKTCLWEILSEKQFPGLQESYRQMVKDPRMGLYLFTEKIQQAVEAETRVTINHSYRLPAQDLPLVLGLRAQAMFYDEYMQISELLAGVEATRLQSLGRISDVSLIQSLQQEALDVGLRLKNYFAKGPLVRAAEVGIVNSPSGGWVPIPELLPTTLMWKLDRMFIIIDPAVNRKAELAAVTGLKEVLKDWTLKGELKFGDRLKTWLQILFVAFHYNATFYLPRRQPLSILYTGNKKDFEGIESTIDGTRLRQWVERYVATLEAKLKVQRPSE